jgi:chromosome segregation ATPase
MDEANGSVDLGRLAQRNESNYRGMIPRLGRGERVDDVEITGITISSGRSLANAQTDRQTNVERVGAVEKEREAKAMQPEIDALDGEREALVASFRQLRAECEEKIREAAAPVAKCESELAQLRARQKELRTSARQTLLQTYDVASYEAELARLTAERQKAIEGCRDGHDRERVGSSDVEREAIAAAAAALGDVNARIEALDARRFDADFQQWTRPATIGSELIFEQIDA